MIKEEKSDNSIKLEAGTMYDINKGVLNSCPVLTEEELIESKKLILDFLQECKDYYYMLLCRERYDYTIFNLENSQDDLVNILVDECLKNRGEIKSIEKTDDGAIEIWLTIEKESYCYYFFQYGNAVIGC